MALVVVMRLCKNRIWPWVAQRFLDPQQPVLSNRKGQTRFHLLYQAALPAPPPSPPLPPLLLPNPFICSLPLVPARDSSSPRGNVTASRCSSWPGAEWTSWKVSSPLDPASTASPGERRGRNCKSCLFYHPDG